MDNPIHRAGEAMFTRRRALGLMGAITASTASVAGAAPLLRPKTADPILTPEAQLEAAVAALEEAMVAIHGDDSVRVVRDGNNFISVIKRPKPYIREWQGAGYYEVKIAWNLAPIFHVVHFSAFDDFKDGRCFRLAPRDADEVGIRYMYERDLQRALVRKL